MAYTCDKCGSIFKYLSHYAHGPSIEDDEPEMSLVYLVEHHFTQDIVSLHDHRPVDFVNLPNGMYCSACIADKISQTKPTHIQPASAEEFVERLFFCDCETHTAARRVGGKNLIKILAGLGFDTYKFRSLR